MEGISSCRTHPMDGFRGSTIIYNFGWYTLYSIIYSGHLKEKLIKKTLGLRQILMRMVPTPTMPIP